MTPGIRKSPGSIRSRLVLCLVFTLSLPLAAAAADWPIAEPVISRTGISWNVVIEHEGLSLNVRGRDCVLDESFRTGETPRLDPSDFAGERLEDGRYAWELRAVPVVDAEVRERLAEVRKLDDPMAEKRLLMQLRREGEIPWQPITQSGYFTLERGVIILDEPESHNAQGAESQSAEAEPATQQASSPPATKDQVIPDDLIVDGSLCVGFDCVNNENFGFDTIRLKENNLRIKFEDTSVGSFPSRDWQLTANDSASGGASKFSIEDITGSRVPFTLEAGSPTSSLFVDDGGRVGLGTATPVLEVHVVDGDTPSMRLDQDSSSGFTPQVWDVAGNETNFFVRDVTGGSTLPFRIRPGAPTNSINIASDGDVGIGTASPAQKLEVAGGDLKVGKTTGGNTSFFIENTGGTSSSWILRANGSNGAFTFTESGGNTAFKINAGPQNNALTITSTGVDITGNLRVNGMTMNVPDYVFEPTYELLPIEKQGEYMLANKHLPAVGAAQYDEAGHAMIDIGRNQMGMLEELEKAHLYIQQLAQQNAELRAQLEQQRSELETRLARLEADRN